jgi:hypothetical protein
MNAPITWQIWLLAAGAVAIEALLALSAVVLLAP